MSHMDQSFKTLNLKHESILENHREQQQGILLKEVSPNHDKFRELNIRDTLVRDSPMEIN